MEKGDIGQPFNEFLEEEGIYEEATGYAIKQVLAFRLKQEMKEQGITKMEMAKRLLTSRSQLDRLLDPENDGVTLNTLTNAAKALGRTLRIELV